jgi:succinate-semialdehyde dehydrogenase/glutarate-semialdehyde dehydrogenase
MLESKLVPDMKGYIDGAWTSAASGRTLAVTDPATGDRLADVPDMDGEDTARAVEAAARCFARGPEPLEQRKARLTTVGDAIREHRRELGRIITLENGKPLDQGVGEADYAAGFFHATARNLHALAPHTLEERPREHAWTVHYRPAGVAALITPWNFPLAMVAKKLAAALAAGCPVVVKPSEITPLSMIALFTLLERTGLPAGAVNLVIGMPEPIGKVLCEHPDVRVLSFTGSTRVGKHLIRTTADLVKRLALELGGNAPFIVFEDADLDRAVEHLIQNKFRGSGQTCVCANRVLVQRAVMEPFATRLETRVRALTTGPGLAEGVDVGPLINRSGYEKVERHLKDALDKGAVRTAAGALPDNPGPGRFFPPTVLRGVTPDMLCAREETFGPLVPLMEFESEDDAVTESNDTEYGLAAYLFTGDPARAERVIARLRFGHMGHNTGTGPAPEAPFGGMKQSGIGREGGREGLLEFVEIQTVPRS